MIKDRWYQTEACEAFWQYVKADHDASHNPVLVLPTGTGKSIIIARIIQQAITWWPHVRVLMLTHVGELVKQNAAKLAAIWPDADIGICSASLGSKDKDQAIIFGNVQSVAIALKKDPHALGLRNLVVIDECHMLSDAETSQYRIVINTLKGIHPRMRVLGLSATPYRTKGGLLTEQTNAIFTNIVYDLSAQFERLINEGFLAPLVTLQTAPHIDLDNVKILGGDYKADDVAKAVNDDEMLVKACELIKKYGQNRRAWLVFVSGIANGEKVAGLLQHIGVNALSVNSSHNAAFNNQAIADFRAGKVQCLVSADQLTTGFDVPQVELIAMLRPTMSAGLHVQMLGRGTRPAEGKKDCLVLDFARNIERLGPINAPLIRKKGERTNRNQRAMVKACPKCGLYIHLSCRQCPNCGHEFKQDFDLELQTGLVIEKTFGRSPRKGCKLATVMAVKSAKHTSASSGKTSFKLQFICSSGGKKRSMSTWFHFDSKGSAFSAAVNKWIAFGGKSPAPYSVDEAMQRSQELTHTPQGLEYVPKNFYSGRLYDEIVEFIWE